MGIDTHIEGAIQFEPALPHNAIDGFWAAKYVRFVAADPHRPQDGYSAIVADHDDGWFRNADDTVYALADLVTAHQESRCWSGHLDFQVEYDHPSSLFRASVARRAGRYEVVVTWPCHEHGNWPDPRFRGVVVSRIPEGRNFESFWTRMCTCR